MTRKTQQQVMVVTTPAIGPGYHFDRGDLLLFTGPVPVALAQHVANLDGTVHSGRRVREIDSALFERDAADEARRQSAPQPVADRSLTVAEIVRDVLNGDAEAFQRADALGFPRQLGRRVNGSRVEGLWRERDVRRWAEQIRATAAALTSERDGRRRLQAP